VKEECQNCKSQMTFMLGRFSFEQKETAGKKGSGGKKGILKKS